jgi:hypothetical protein
MNSPYQSGQGDSQTGFPYAGGGLNAGDYFDLTNDEAAGASNTATGLCWAGRYRYVQVDSGATATNVKTGTVGYLRSGGSIGRVKSVAITAAGSGQTNGNYSIAATAGSGGGTGAIVQVIIVGGAVTSATVTAPGVGYSTVPTFTVSEGGTPGTLAAQLDTSANIVTSYDQIGVTSGGSVRPVVFLNAITPGNYGFIQELGVATVLGNATIGTAAIQNFIASTTGGTVNSQTTLSVATIGQAIDLPLASNLFKIYMGITAVVVQD